MYYPKVSHPNLSTTIPQMRSGGFQSPFFFGGSQVPIALGMPSHQIRRGKGTKIPEVKPLVKGIIDKLPKF